MMSFTGSTRAGILVAKAAADTVKRVHQELGGKSANILFPDVDLQQAVTKGVAGCFGNSGQSCNAPTRMFVPRDRHDEAAAHAKAAAETFVVGPADAPGTHLGPVVSQVQFDKIQDLIESGIAGRRHAGDGRQRAADRRQPRLLRAADRLRRRQARDAHRPRGDLRARPVDHALRHRRAGDPAGQRHALRPRLLHSGKGRRQGPRAAARMRTGNVHINYPAWDAGVPFGGYKQSGNGREYAEYGLEDFLEIKGILGYEAA